MPGMKQQLAGGGSLSAHSSRPPAGAPGCAAGRARWTGAPPAAHPAAAGVPAPLRSHLLRVISLSILCRRTGQGLMQLRYHHCFQHVVGGAGR